MYLALSISLMAYLGLRLVSQHLTPKHIVKLIADSLAHVVSFSVAVSSANIQNEFLSEPLWLPVFASIFVALNFELYKRLSSARLRRFVHLFAGSLFAFSFALNMLEFDGFAAPMLGLIAGAALMLYAWKYNYRTFMLFGAVLIVMAVRYQLEGLIEILFNHSWISLAVIGSSTIVLASVIERHGASLKMKVLGWSRSAKQKHVGL